MLTLFAKVFGKLYSLMLGGWNSLFLEKRGDPTRILLEYFTLEQRKAQKLLDALPLQTSKRATLELVVIVPFRDRWDLTEQCLSYLAQQKFAREVDIRLILVNNRSAESQTLQSLQSAPDRYARFKPVIVNADYEFNYSRINNDAVRLAGVEAGSILLFLNNDVELRDTDILQKMIDYLTESDEIGAVGCTLLYPTGVIQHAFAAPGVKIIAAHPLKGLTYNETLTWFQTPARPVAAVTGAVMMVRSEDFLQVGMFDESLAVLGQDIDLCLKIENQLGKFSVAVRSSLVFHLEGPTKSSFFPKAEIQYFYRKWPQRSVFERYYHPRFSRWSERPVLKVGFELPYPAVLFGDRP